jgi:hypothetical protein
MIFADDLISLSRTIYPQSMQLEEGFKEHNDDDKYY